MDLARDAKRPGHAPARPMAGAFAPTRAGACPLLGHSAKFRLAPRSAWSLPYPRCIRTGISRPSFRKCAM